MATAENNRGSIPIDRLEYEDVRHRAEGAQTQAPQPQNMNSPQPPIQYNAQMQHRVNQSPQYSHTARQFHQMQNTNVPNHNAYLNQQFTRHSQEPSTPIRYDAAPMGYPQKSPAVPRPHSADFLDYEKK